MKYQHFLVANQFGGLDQVVHLPVEGPAAERFFDEFCNAYMANKDRAAITPEESK